MNEGWKTLTIDTGYPVQSIFDTVVEDALETFRNKFEAHKEDIRRDILWESALDDQKTLEVIRKFGEFVKQRTGISYQPP